MDSAGKDLGEVLGTGKKLGVKVSDNAKALFNKTKADVVLHTAGSRIPTRSICASRAEWPATRQRQRSW